ncbi:hypothetical protein [Clostridium sp. DJ247]|uniref:hypothetical protein n=1 Tax=Clostridium sp. DJ247 TaxID=2726188 RepID=UPI0016279759|nr:hypothetical protein [Clostridium sp. DJ247]MBC2578842.1 hypothetical protein [Clostridium sp. DJ247]
MSALTYGDVIIPAIRGFTLVGEVIFIKASLILLRTTLTGTASYLLWYYSIHKIGATRGMILNMSDSALAIIF